MLTDIAQPRTEPVLDDLANVLRRRKLVVVVTALGALLATFAALLFMPERYEAEARLMMILGREDIQVPVTVQNGGVYATGVQREEINSEIQLLRSHEVVGKAIAAIGLDRFEFRPPPPQTSWQRLKYAIGAAKRWAQNMVTEALIRAGLLKRLSAEDKAVALVNESLDATRDADSNVIRVSLQLPDRDVALATLARLLEFYYERHVAIRAASTVLPLLDTQVDKDRAEIASLKEYRLKLIHAWSLASTASKSSELEARMEKVLYDADGKRSELAEAQRRLDTLSSSTRALPAEEAERQTESPNPAVRPIQDRLNELRIRRAELVSHYKDASVPFIRQVDEQIQGLETLRTNESDTERTTTYVSNPVRQSLEQQREVGKVTVAGLRAAIEEDKRHADALARELTGLQDGESRMQMVDLRLEAAEKRFLLDSSRRDEAQINEALDRTQITNVVTLSATNASPEPVAPKKLRILLIGLAAGLLLGLGAGMLLEWSDDTIYGTRELFAATRLPYLGDFRIGSDLHTNA